MRRFAEGVSARLGRRAEAPDASVSLGGRNVPVAHPLFQIRAADLAASRDAAAGPPLAQPASATWFVPYFRHIAFGGINTIFRFIEGFAARGLEPTIVIYDNASASAEALAAEVRRSFPRLTDAKVVIFDMDRDTVSSLPPTDLGFCTFWASAYLLLRFNQVRRKLYFIQDYEPLFYAAGPAYALAESTYRFGLEGIVNTPGLLDALGSQHGLVGTTFVPAVDPRYYFPPSSRRRDHRLRIFFYARPGQPRNAFWLGLEAIRQLVSAWGDRIEVVTAGGEWDERDHGLSGKVVNLGLLGTLQEVGELYRSCDIGVVYSLSKHPSYQPFEFMACGMATVSNRNEDNLWFLEDGSNCLLAEPSASALTEAIERLISDAGLRERIQVNGVASVSSDWEAQVDHIWRHLSAAAA